MAKAEEATLRVLDILPGTSVDGPGLRTSVYFAGCAHRCPGCHNPQSWDFDGGNEMTVGEIVDEIERHGFNVTLSGGDPLYQPDGVITLAEELRRRGYTIWLYTGFLFEQMLSMPGMERLLPLLEVVVDGPFLEAERDLSLLFRGSRNQRLIRVADSAAGKICLWEENF